MTWFVIQRLFSTPSGGTTVDYLGPFYGDPTKAISLLAPNNFILIYSNGTWLDLRKA